MKLLLDESIPRRLAASFPDIFDVTTVRDMGWSGMKNGDLLRLSGERGFLALITADQGIEYQQKLSALPLAVIVLHAHRTRLQDLVPLMPKIVDLLKRSIGKDVYHVAA
jgi:predicted nuclease of predicted toxin-antitoxin system